VLRRLLYCLLSGALLACSTPPMNVYPMAWVGLVALFLLLDDGPLPARPAMRDVARGSLRGLVFGLGTNLVALRFVSVVITRFAPLPSFVGPIALVVLAAFEGLRLAIAGIAYQWLVRARVPRVLSFAIAIYAGTFMPSMIPWTVTCGVCPWPATVQHVELVGERGAAFMMALEAALVGVGIERLRRRERNLALRSIGVAAGMVVLTLVYGAVRIRQIDATRAAAPKASVAIVVVGVEATERWEKAKAKEILARLTEFTLQAEREPTDLVIWPEAAYPYSIPHVSRHSPTGEFAILQPGVRGPVLTGIVLSGSQGRYNSAVVAVRNGSVSEPYDKMHLMWFGEMVPFEDSIPWLRHAFSRGVGLRAGEHQVALEAPPVRLAVLNCLEDILPDAGREAMQVAPNLLVNLTNDAWFAGTAESDYHLLLSRLRSIELRRDLVRAVNYGPTTWVDAAGRVVARIPGGSPGVLRTGPALLESPLTPFARWGEWPLTVLLGITVFLLRAGVLRGKAEAIGQDAASPDGDLAIPQDASKTAMSGVEGTGAGAER
jgi:apolipoprotein N-acyltransferase